MQIHQFTLKRSRICDFLLFPETINVSKEEIKGLNARSSASCVDFLFQGLKEPD